MGDACERKKKRVLSLSERGGDLAEKDETDSVAGGGGENLGKGHRGGGRLISEPKGESRWASEKRKKFSTMDHVDG